MRSENLQYMVAIWYGSKPYGYHQLDGRSHLQLQLTALFPQTLYLFEYNLWGMISLFIALVIHSVDHTPVDHLLTGNISKMLCLFECNLWDCLLTDFCTAWFSSCSHSAVPWPPSACRHHSIQDAYKWYSYSVHIIYHLYYTFNRNLNDLKMVFMLFLSCISL